MIIVKAKMPLRSGSAVNTPKLLVIHAMGEIIRIDQDAHDHYRSKGKNVPIRDYHAYDWLNFIGYSAHGLITPNGTLIECRKDDEGAYHAKGFNTDSLGYEFLVKGIHTYFTLLNVMRTDWLTNLQFTIGVELFKEKMNKWNISINKVTTHHILTPTKKEDPGIGFPLNKFKTTL